MKTINELVIRNPEDTPLGRKILTEAVNMIDHMGFEEFNFKKLADEMKSTEASIYRYFENKHQLLAYLVNGYWKSLLINIKINLNNILCNKEKLQTAIVSIVKSQQMDLQLHSFDQNKLHAIAVENASKISHLRKVDDMNKAGAFKDYKNLVEYLSQLILEIDGSFKYPKSLANTLIEMSLNNEFYALHLPRLTDEKTLNVKIAQDETYKMVIYMIDRLLFHNEQLKD